MKCLPTTSRRMKRMKFNKNIPVYGDTSFRGSCPKEAVEQITFFNKIRKTYPDTLGLIATHNRNEGKRTAGQVHWQYAEGLTVGVSDITIAGSPSFCCELKRTDHTKSKWQDGQQEYLIAAKKQGAFVCVALGWEAAWAAMEEWLLVVSSEAKD